MRKPTFLSRWVLSANCIRESDIGSQGDFTSFLPPALKCISPSHRYINIFSDFLKLAHCPTYNWIPSLSGRNRPTGLNEANKGGRGEAEKFPSQATTPFSGCQKSPKMRKQRLEFPRKFLPFFKKNMWAFKLFPEQSQIIIKPYFEPRRTTLALPNNFLSSPFPFFSLIGHLFSAVGL